MHSAFLIGVLLKSGCFPGTVAYILHIFFLPFSQSKQKAQVRSYNYLPANSHRSVENAVHAKDGRLRGVDDGRAKQGAKHAAVADGEGAAVHVLNGQSSCPCLPKAKGNGRTVSHHTHSA